MIQRQSTYTVEGSLTGEKIAMSIDTSQMGHIMNVLTNLYNDPPLAVVREYSTNAWDSHVAAGVSLPIEITLPNSLSPFLTIRDYGVGLSRDDILEIYSKYGASTKRESDDFNGQLGLGCKSALTYAQQFTVTGVKDGERAQIAVSRDEIGGGQMTVVDKSPTDDAAGVTVQIPVKRGDTYVFGIKAREFFQHWPEGSVLIDGKEPERPDERALLRLSPTMYLVPSLGQNKIVMGNVAYPFTLDEEVAAGHSLVAHVTMGEVAFTPSRESLHLTAETKATIERVYDEAVNLLEDAAEKAVESAPDRESAFREMMRWRRLNHALLRREYTYRGDVIPLSIEVADWRIPDSSHYRGWVVNEDAKPILQTSRNSSTLSAHHRVYDVKLEYLSEYAVWFHGYERRTFTAPMKRKLRQWAREREMSNVDSFYLSDFEPRLDGWVPTLVRSWSEIEAIRLPKEHAPVAGGPYAGRIRPTGSYDAFVDGVDTEGLEAAKIDTSKPLFYARGNSWQVRHYAHAIAWSYPRATLVYMPANRIRKFARDFPNAKKAVDVMSDCCKKWERTLTADDLYDLGLERRGYVRTRLAALNEAKLDDPELKRAILSAKKNLTQMIGLRRVFYQVGLTLTYPDIPDHFGEYPLFDWHHFQSDPDHLYLYMNAVYAAR